MNPLKLVPLATMLIAVCVCQGQSIQATLPLGKPAQRRSSWKRVKVNGEYGAILPREDSR